MSVGCGRSAPSLYVDMLAMVPAEEYWVLFRSVSDAAGETMKRAGMHELRGPEKERIRLTARVQAYAAPLGVVAAPLPRPRFRHRFPSEEGRGRPRALTLLTQ